MTAPAPTPPKRLRVWDLPARLFHWVLVALVVTSWASAQFAESLHDATLKYHCWSGYGVLVLVVWRVLWGFVGPAQSRLSRFVKSPAAALIYARDLISGTTRRFLGHNPLGGYMVLALLLVLLAQATLGLFVADREELATGPLYKLIDPQLWKPVRHWHHFIFNRVILPLAILHIAVNLSYQFVKREPLITAMVTGDKPAMAYEDQAGSNTPQPSNARALLCLLASAVLVFGMIATLGGKI